MTHSCACKDVLIVGHGAIVVWVLLQGCSVHTRISVPVMYIIVALIPLDSPRIQSVYTPFSTGGFGTWLCICVSLLPLLSQSQL